MNQSLHQRASNRLGICTRLTASALLAMAASAGASQAWGASATSQPTTAASAPKITALPPSTRSSDIQLKTGAAKKPIASPLATRPSMAAATQPAHTVHAAATPPLGPGAPYPTDPMHQQADLSLAERLTEIAQQSLPQKVSNNALWDPLWKQVSAMLEAATKLSSIKVGDVPRPDARISRLAVEAIQQSGDTDALKNALYAAHAADPRNDFITLQIIEMYAAKMETAQDRLAYLKQVFSTHDATVPNEVRARCGVKAAQLLVDRGQPDEAQKILDEALRLNSVDTAGLRLRYQLLGPKATAYERATALMGILTANPAQAVYTAALADELARAGLAAESVPWYRLTLSLTSFAGNTDLNAARNAIVEMLLADRGPDALNLANKLVEIQPTLSDNWFLKLAVMQDNTSPEDYQAALQQARNALTNNIVTQVNTILPNATDKPTTRPISDPGPYLPPDLALAVAQLNQGGSAAAKKSFVTANSDLATLELLFAQQPQNTTKLLDAISAVVPANDPQLQLFQGWAALERGEEAEARSKLTPLAKTNPLAQLALIRMMGPDKHDEAAAQARKLLSDNPSGPVAAVLVEQLRNLDAHIVLSAQAQSLQQAADSFPVNWLGVLEHPQSFYAIHVEPEYVACSFAEPMLARLTIQNMGTNPLTIGTDGVLQRMLVIGAQSRGNDDHNFPEAAVDEIAGPLVLAPGQETSQVVRVDQFQLSQYLHGNPDQSIQVYATAETNPGPGPGGVPAPGPCGYQVQFLKVFSRLAQPVGSPAYQRALTDLEPGSMAQPRQKMSDLELLARQIQLINGMKNAQATAKQVAAVNLEHLHGGRRDSNPAVAAWASFLSAMVADDTARRDMLLDMVASTDWRQREMALVGLPTIKQPAEQVAIAKKLAEDPEPSVRLLAQAKLALAAAVAKAHGPATSQAASHP